MKKIGFAIFGICLILASCAKQELPQQNNDGTSTSPDPISPDELVEMTISVTAPKTRTSLSDVDSDGVMDDVVWQEGDMISIWDGYANRKFVLIEGAGGTKAKFRGPIYYKATKVYALYPYCETFITEVPPTDLEEGKQGYARLLFSNDAVQYAVENGYDPSAAFAMAEADSPDAMTFDQKTSLLKISLGADMADVVGVRFSGNAASDYVWGTVSLRLIDAVTVWPGVINRSDINPLGRGKELTLCNEDGSPLKTGVDYYMVIPATEFDRGYKISFVHKDGTVSSRSSGKYAEYNTGMIYSLASGPITKSMFHSYYEQFMAGEELKLANWTVSNSSGIGLTAVNDEKVKLIESNQTFTITENGIYFIRGGADVTVESAASNSLTGIVLVGDNKYYRSPVKIRKGLAPTKTNFILHNLELSSDESGSSNNMFTFKTTAFSTSGRFGMENCKVALSLTNFVYMEDGITLSDVSLKNNDFAVSAEGASVSIFLSPETSESVMQKVSITENLFYHTAPEAFGGPDLAATNGYGFNIFSAKLVTLSSLSLTYNTIVALPTRAASKAYVTANVPYCYITRNLFYNPYQPCEGRILQNDYNGEFHDNFRRNVYSVYDALNGTDTNTNKMVFDSNISTDMNGDPITEEADKQYLTKYNWCPFTNCSTATVYATGDFKKKNDADIFSDAGLTGDVATGTVGATRPVVIN